MVLGLGLDVAELDRIRESLSRFGERFISRVLTPAEAANLPKNRPEAYVAARFAAKEACAKALGTGFADGVTLHGIEVRNLPSGAPTLALHGRALELARAMGATRLHLSLTHGRDTAAAVVILEGSPL
ncbi:MAG: holo-[acyl-carrier-protein] synthase [Desulfovibrionaceae bacterium CG1_02_65_16]|nr:MAG: holo-[acyl-carrier-protein] synthase [Desulfovibrionaceae bacterium CG1_02_65_16]